MRDVGEVRLIWRYHNENEWQGVCDTSGWGCIRCKWDQGERVCTVDLRIRPRFSQLCHMAVLGHELGHALGKMHDEPQVRVIPVSFIPTNTPPASAPDSSPVAAPSANTMRDEEETIAAVSLEPLPRLTPPHLYEMLERVNPIELADALTDRKEASGGMALRLDRAQSFASLHLVRTYVP